MPAPAGDARRWRLPEALSLRLADDADGPFLCAVYASTRADELQAVPWSDDDRQRFLQSQFALQHTHYRTHYANTQFLVVLHADVPIGRLYLSRGSDDIRLMDIALLPAWRGRGIGRALLAALLDEADAAGHAVSLHVERDNPVQRHYARTGFVLVDDGPVYQFLRRSPRSGVSSA